MAEETDLNLLGLTTTVVAAYVENNTIRADEIASLIANVHRALGGVGTPQKVPEPEQQAPAVTVKKSVQPDFIVCLEEGKKQKSLKRHLQSAHGLTPQQYRERWSLPRGRRDLAQPLIWTGGGAQ